MFRKRGENLHSIYILLFLNVAFFFLEHQDASRFASLFTFDRASFVSGEWWRVLTYQFSQAGQGWMFIPKAVVLFFTLLILYLMGSAVEEEWGTRGFMTFFLVSTIATAGFAAWLNVPLLGSFFVNYSLLFVFASMFPDQAFYLFAVVPIRVRWLAYASAFLLVYGIFRGGVANIAVLGGSVAGYVYFLLHRMPRVVKRPAAVKEKETSGDLVSVRNAARFVAIKKAINGGRTEDVDRLITQCEHDKVAGVNICPPADYKPESVDGYCIRCEGFSECAARYLRLNRPAPPPPPAVPEPTA